MVEVAPECRAAIFVFARCLGRNFSVLEQTTPDQTRQDIRLDADYEQDGLGRGEAHQVLQGEVWREDRRVLGGGVDEVGAQGSEACPAQRRGVLATFNLRRRALRVRVLVADRVSGRSVQGAVGQGVRLRAPVQEAPGRDARGGDAQGLGLRGVHCEHGAHRQAGLAPEHGACRA